MDPLLEQKRVRKSLERAGFAMFVTLDNQGTPNGRPMLPLWLPRDPSIYFLTHQDSRKVAEIAERPRVVLTMISDHSYFVVLGAAYVSRDPALIRRLWHPSYRAWFPAGKDDRGATVVRVVVDRVNYWDPPRSQVLRVVQAAWALVTGSAVETPMKTIDRL